MSEASNSNHVHIIDKHKILDDQQFVCEICKKDIIEIVKETKKKTRGSDRAEGNNNSKAPDWN